MIGREFDIRLLCTITDKKSEALAPALECGKRCAVARGDAAGSVAVVKAVAERDHGARCIAGDERGQTGQRRAGVHGQERHRW